MASRSGLGEIRPRPEQETSGSLAEGCETTKNNPPRLESRTPPSCALNVGFEAYLLACARLTTRQDSIQTPGVYPECAGQEQAKEKSPGPRDKPQHVPSSSGSAMHMDENEEPVITSMKFLCSVWKDR